MIPLTGESKVVARVWEGRRNGELPNSGGRVWKKLRKFQRFHTTLHSWSTIKGGTLLPLFIGLISDECFYDHKIKICLKIAYTNPQNWNWVNWSYAKAWQMWGFCAPVPMVCDSFCTWPWDAEWTHPTHAVSHFPPAKAFTELCWSH